MRTKECDGVRRFDVTALEPKPEIYLAYDGLLGLSKRVVIADIVRELTVRKGLQGLADFVNAMRRSRGGGDVHIYFDDYVSYGIGGGDAVAEYCFGRFLLLYADESRPLRHGERHDGPPLLALKRGATTESVPLADLVASGLLTPTP